MTGITILLSENCSNTFFNVVVHSLMSASRVFPKMFQFNAFAIHPPNSRVKSHNVDATEILISSPKSLRV